MTAESQVPRMFAAAALPYEELVARLMDAATAPAAKPPCRRITESVMPGRSRVPAAQVAVHDPLEVWKTWATDLRDGQVQAGHFLPEEAPRERCATSWRCWGEAALEEREHGIYAL